MELRKEKQATFDENRETKIGYWYAHIHVQHLMLLLRLWWTPNFPEIISDSDGENEYGGNESSIVEESDEDTHEWAAICSRNTLLVTKKKQ